MKDRHLHLLPPVAPCLGDCTCTSSGVDDVRSITSVLPAAAPDSHRTGAATFEPTFNPDALQVVRRDEALGAAIDAMGLL